MSPLRTALLLLVLVLPPPLSAQSGGGQGKALAPRFPEAGRYYVSNELGMPLQEIPRERAEEAAYLLVVEPGPGPAPRPGGAPPGVAGEQPLELRRLLHGGEEIRRWESWPREQRVYEAEQLSELYRYDAEGRLTEEQHLSEGKLLTRTVLCYLQGRLCYADTFDGEGTLQYRVRYQLSPDGALRRVQRQASPESAGGAAVEAQGTPAGGPPEEQWLALSSAGGRVYEERLGSPGQKRVNRYDEEGRLLQSELWQGARLLEQRRFRYRAGEGQIESSELLEPELKRSTRSLYDEGGRLSSTTVEQDGRQVEQIEYAWNEAGQLVCSTRRAERGLEQWRYLYDEAGTLAREEYSVRGSLEKVTLHGENGARTEELYRDGELSLKVYLEDSRKTREEVYEHGRIVRVREYP
jgi:antitoxin component YwqK of YwqJK toxin-antitoxin module